MTGMGLAFLNILLAFAFTLAGCATSGSSGSSGSPGLPQVVGNVLGKVVQQILLDEAGIDLSGQGRLAFRRDPADRPVVSAGRAGLPNLMFDPYVLKDEEGLHLFVTAACCIKNGEGYISWDPANPGDCDVTKAFASTAYAYSPDNGFTWTFRPRPVIYPPQAGWDSRKIETPSVVRVSNALFLFYSGDGDYQGRPFEQRFQIGVGYLELVDGSIRKTLLDHGRTFTRRGPPVIPFETGRRAFTNNTQEPSVLFKDGRYELYFIGLELKLPDQPIDHPGQGIAGIGMGRALLGTDLNRLEQTPEPILHGVNIIEVKHVGDQYYLFGTTLSTSGEEFHEGEEIEYHTSPDGIHWSKGGLLLRRGGGGAFDNWGLMAPTIVQSDGSLLLFYTAFQVEGHPCFPVPPGGRLGSPISDNRCVYPSIGRATAPLPRD